MVSSQVACNNQDYPAYYQAIAINAAWTDKNTKTTRAVQRAPKPVHVHIANRSMIKVPGLFSTETKSIH